MKKIFYFKHFFTRQTQHFHSFGAPSEFLGFGKRDNIVLSSLSGGVSPPFVAVLVRSMLRLESAQLGLGDSTIRCIGVDHVEIMFNIRAGRRSLLGLGAELDG